MCALCALFLYALCSLFTHIWAIMDRIINASARDSHHMPNTCAIFLSECVYQMSHSQWQSWFLSSVVCFLTLINTNTNTRTFCHSIEASPCCMNFYFFDHSCGVIIFILLFPSRNSVSFFSFSRFLAFMVLNRNVRYGK